MIGIGCLGIHEAKLLMRFIRFGVGDTHIVDPVLVHGREQECVVSDFNIASRLFEVRPCNIQERNSEKQLLGTTKP